MPLIVVENHRAEAKSLIEVAGDSRSRDAEWLAAEPDFVWGVTHSRH